MSPIVRRGVRLAMAGLLCLAPGAAGQTAPAAPLLVRTAAAAAPSTALTLDEAIRLAEARSEQIAAAQSGVDRAAADQLRARSGRLPQVAGTASYDRTLKSEFSGLFSSGSSNASCDPFALNPAAPLDARVAEIERALDCGAFTSNLFGGGDASKLPFGQANTYRLGISISQAVYSGGRLTAQRALASVGRNAAEDGVRSARAQLVLDATQAYYDAALAERLVAIADAMLKQAEATLAQVELSRQAGRLAEFDLLRARVARDNARPAVIRARAQRTIALLRVKQMLELPLDAEITVSVDLDDAMLPPPARFAAGLAAVVSADTARTADARIPVRQAAFSTQALEASVRIAKSARLPYVGLSSALGGVAYAGFPAFGDWRANWTVGAFVQIPLFTGGRLKADELAARADLSSAEARRKLTRELAQSDTVAAIAELDAAQATWEASAGTVDQASRAYEIAELRYREGISTQIELLDGRLILQQAQVNRAQAARDLQVARARVALLPELPLGTVASAAALRTASSSGAGASGQQ